MTKTVHPVLKKTGAVLLTVLVLVLMAVPALAVALPDAPTGYVYDGANVLSSSTESYIERTGSALAEACGAEVVVATVDFTDGEDIADYAYDLFNKWGIGDKRANNGLLILLSVGAEDYYAEPGVGLTDVFTGGVLDAMLYDYLEDDFAAKEYDSGVKKFIGPPLHESFMEFYGFSKEQAFEAVDRYRVRYKEKGVYENRLYPGMKELLEALKSAGVKLSVSTSKPTVFTEKILKQNGIFELFDQIVGANLDGSMTDKTEVMQEAMRRAGGKENNTFFMVGDRSFDMIGAKNCGVPGIGVYFGFAEPGELEEAGADYTVETTEELKILLMKLVTEAEN